MPVFAYKGITAAGKSTRGHLDAESSRGGRARLRHDGIFVTEFAETEGEVPRDNCIEPFCGPVQWITPTL